MARLVINPGLRSSALPTRSDTGSSSGIRERSHNRKAAWQVHTSGKVYSGGSRYTYQTLKPRNNGTRFVMAARNKWAASRSRAADIRAREARSAVLVRRREDAYRRGEMRRAGEALDAVPGLLSSILGIAFALVFIVHLWGLIANGTDMVNFFAGDTSDILQSDTFLGNHGADVTMSDPFYHIGAQVSEVTYTTSTGQTVTGSSMTGKYVSAQATFDWVKGLASDIPTYASNPVAYGAAVFWNFINDTLSGFVTGDFGIVGDIGESLLELIQGAIGGFVDGISEWWNKIFGGGN